MDNNKAIGVFDSGIGGISVLRELCQFLPHEDFVYVADSAHAPYGAKGDDFIRTRACVITEFLVQQGVKAIVVACNTATASAIALLRATFDLPIIGVEPAIKPAVALSRSKRIGVLATEGTLRSAKFCSLLAKHGSEACIIAQACPGLVEQIEIGNISGAMINELVKTHTLSLVNQNVDTIILGCTHYPLIKNKFSDVAGPSITIVDTGAAVARQTRRLLQQGNLLSGQSLHGNVVCWTTGLADQVSKTISSICQENVQVRTLPAMLLPAINDC